MNLYSDGERSVWELWRAEVALFVDALDGMKVIFDSIGETLEPELTRILAAISAHAELIGGVRR